MKKQLPPLVLVGLFSLLLSLSFVVNVVPSEAQRSTPTVAATPTVRATPTSIGGNSNDDDDDDEPVIIQEGTVRGFVIDYSSGGIPLADVPVILDGGGWQAETRTNSEGYYVFAGLGSGEATLNVVPPSGAQATMPDWPVDTTATDPDNTNLGIYYGSTDSLPVVLSLTPEIIFIPTDQTGAMTVQVENQSGGEANNLRVELVLPAQVSVKTARLENGGVSRSEDGRRLLARIDQLADGNLAELTLELAFDTVNPQAVDGYVTLTYNEQLTGQLIPVMFEVGTATNTAGASRPANPSTEADSTELIPTTGGGNSEGIPWPSLLMSILVILGLVYAGYRTFRSRRLLQQGD